MTPLEALIRAEIAATGPLRLDRYMALCLSHPEHGYYMTRDPFGSRGDFTTAPEVSQMFGELIGAFAAQVWQDQGRPDPFVLAEFGPGRGTLMRDALRATRTMAGFNAAARIHLVETSPVLRARQAETLHDLAPVWVSDPDALPPGSLIAIANEFFDALPLRQFRRQDPGWQERRVGISDAGRLAFGFGPILADADLDARFTHLPDGVLVEVSALGAAVAGKIGARIAGAGGGALFIDYGAWDGTGDTLQAVRAHASTDPLDRLGETDLTAHVRFRALADAAVGVRVWGPVPQGAFLDRLGIGARTQVLARAEARRPEILAQHHRLTHAQEMGTLFKALAFTPAHAAAPPGFDP